jgi:hypothetical protein
MRRNRLNVFSLPFLDCICCGLGAIILLFVVVNAKSAARKDAVTTDLRAEVTRLEMALEQDRADLVAAHNALADTDNRLALTQGLSRQILETIAARKVELADDDKQTLAVREHANKLKADIKAIEEELRRLRAAAREQDPQGDRLRTFPGQGDRHYLTDLKMGGRRILILADASASMLAEAIVDVIRRRNLPDRDKLRSVKWRQAVNTVDWLTARLPPTSQFQVYTFNETTRPLIDESGGAWLEAGDPASLNQAVERMRQVLPGKGTSLLNAFRAAGQLKPPPDNIFLLTDGLPTMGAKKPWTKRVSSTKRRKLFNDAVRQLPSGVPVNIILLPMEGDPLAADAFWRLAKQSNGSFFSPARDWP